MAGQEGEGLGRREPDYGGGGAQAPEGRLRGPEEVPPIGVVLRAAHHPGTRGGILASGEVRKGVIPPGPFTWGGGAHDQPDNNGIYGQACGDLNTGSYPDCKGKLDHTMHGHWATLHGPAGLC